MPIQEITAKSILRKQKKVDSWFLSRYGMNLYRGCVHNCVYCDGRDEKYQVDGEFGRDVAVKVNAIELLSRELDPARKRVPMKKAYFLVGGGVGDSYQPVETKYQLTRKTLELLLKFNHPAHLLTKSTLIERDIDLIKEIHQTSGALASFSFSSVNHSIGKTFEPGVPEPLKRLKTMEKLKAKGIPVGMFLMPVLPFVSDSEKRMELSIRAAINHGADYIVFGGMTLKPGRQMALYYDRISQVDTDLVPRYKMIYKGDRWGNATGSYYSAISDRFNQICRSLGVPQRVPFRLFHHILDLNDLAVVVLEHLDYALKADKKESSYGKAAYTISTLKEPISEIRDQLALHRGIGTHANQVLQELIETGDSLFYHQICGN